ncbi:hypothetical protein FLONG3_3077 [Fusarium longipes]|uniref:Apple domain-containing protein n=1 Tax=Fusarium longipes TaxID=694270 RepID=A0A395T2E6_9HYPO|nr:hypothetical protein FLONG3_3077 [Fusarium longipes]
MVSFKSLLVVLATTSTIVAGPCKPTTTSTALERTTTTAAEITSTTAEFDTTTTAAPTTTTEETENSTTTTFAETTTSAAAPTFCGSPGHAIDGNNLIYITNAGVKDSAKDCVQACADFTGCDVVDYWSEVSFGEPKGTCEFWSGVVKVDGAPSIYKWYQVSCLASM